MKAADHLFTPRNREHLERARARYEDVAVRSDLARELINPVQHPAHHASRFQYLLPLFALGPRGNSAILIVTLFIALGFLALGLMGQIHFGLIPGTLVALAIGILALVYLWRASKGG